MQWYKNFILAALILLAASVKGQKFYFDNYSVKEGLSQSKVYDLIQDNKGFIWVGTASGVSKFDGKFFKNYSADDGLWENGVQIILQDSYENIWFGHTAGGITVLANGKFYKMVIDSIPVTSDITSIIEDYDHRLWIGTQGSGVFRIDNLNEMPLKKPVITHYTGKSKLSDRVFYITQTHDSTIYFVIDNQIKYFNETENTFLTYKPDGLSFFFQITCMFEDKEHNYWFGTYNGGLLRRNSENGNITVFDSRDGLANNFISCISQDQAGDIWVGTWGGGVTRIDPNFVIFNQNNGLAGNKIRKIIPDREGNVLIGTNENGLSIFKGEHFIGFYPEHGLTSEQTTAIVEDDRNNIWIGTHNGLCKYNLTGTTIKQYQEGGNLLNQEIISLCRTSKGEIWVATKEDGIFHFIPGIEGLKYDAAFNNTVLRYGKIVTSMAIDQNDHIWVGTLDGLFYFEPENKAFDRIMGNEISTLYNDRYNTMWVGRKGKGVVSVKDTAFLAMDTLGNISPLCFTQDKQDNLWIGTEGQGVIVLSPDHTITRYKKDQGLLADLVTALQTDSSGNIWIGTNKGLNQYNYKSQTFYSYTDRSGFTGIEVKNNALYLDKTNNLWCGTVNGLFKYNPKKELINIKEPLTHITNFRVNLKEREMEQGMKLKYTDKSIYFEFHSICLTDAEKVKYKVMLEGADLDWQPATNQTFKTYSPLPPGKYNFKVIACNNRNIWNEQPVEFSFTIKPPFYLTWWFILIMTIMVTTVIIFYIHIRERNLKQEKIILENKVKERTAEVVNKNIELAKKNKDITDSITYAKRIQQAILPSESFIKKQFAESFVLFKPKDIVSGDFYWFKITNNLKMFSAIDCTGHGVPGAFMSIMGHDALQRAVSEFKLLNPADILNKLNELVQESLQSADNPDVKDGMDMALCVYSPKTSIMQYAGANNPVYIVRAENKNELIKDGIAIEPSMTAFGYKLYETKPNKQPIGAYIKRDPFTCHEFTMMPGDAVYIFSDGYADQFGGPQGRKFMYKQLKEIILKNQKSTMEQQKTFYNQIINAWKSNHEQIDDICLIGIKL